MRKHQDLEVWKKSVALVTKIYEITKTFPKDEIYGITNQIRRAAVSIPSNIAEGAGRNHDKEFIQFLYISMGSCSELETQLLICKNIKYLKDENLEDIIKDLIEVRMMISGLVRAVNR